jgi:hypothetical protein
MNEYDEENDDYSDADDFVDFVDFDKSSLISNCLTCDQWRLLNEQGLCDVCVWDECESCGVELDINDFQLCPACQNEKDIAGE